MDNGEDRIEWKGQKAGWSAEMSRAGSIMIYDPENWGELFVGGYTEQLWDFLQDTHRPDMDFLP